MPGIGQSIRKIGKSGMVFLIALAAWFVFFFTGKIGWVLLDSLVVFPLGIVLLIRSVPALYRESVWSVRNRLLIVYALFGGLPVFLVFIFFGITAWALVSELAVYLANSALDRLVQSVRSAVVTVDHIPLANRRQAAPQIGAAFRRYFPDFYIYLHDRDGDYKWPREAPELDAPAYLSEKSGLVLINQHFYVCARGGHNGDEIQILAPVTGRVMAQLVPNLGFIELVESTKGGAGQSGMHFDLFNPKSDMAAGHLPPPASRFDIPLALVSGISHYHADGPSEHVDALLVVRSRPSAVMRAIFTDSDFFRGILAEALTTIAILFLVVELGAIILGVSLSARITTAVNEIYEGTRRVIRGDFTHRIAVTKHDQLGELAASFNQMTGNLERLVVIEKERERLQAEIEIAREVQRQLYPQGDPPTCRLHLTARCDPARMVSGDYYDYQSFSGQKLSFAIGDVAGKGISAALLMATIQASLRAQLGPGLPMAESECSPAIEIDCAALVSKLNKQVWQHTSPEKYATFFFGAYDVANQLLTYTNAGHLPPLLFRGGRVIPLDTNGTVVGAFPSAVYDSSCITLEPNDLLVCYTDGITEPENSYGEMFGEERLISLVQRHLNCPDDEIISIVFEAVRAWTGSPELQDDMTLLVARHGAVSA